MSSSHSQESVVHLFPIHKNGYFSKSIGQLFSENLKQFFIETVHKMKVTFVILRCNANCIVMKCEQMS